MQKPERVSGMFGPDVVSMPDVHTHLHREAPCCVWGYDFPHPSSSHLSGQRELAERRERQRAGRDADEEVGSENVTQTISFLNS